MINRRTSLTIAGSDPSGGAGIQADLKTFSIFGVYGMAIITTLTAQNSRGIKEIMPVSPSFLLHQLNAIFEDIRVDAIKVGMIYSYGNAKILVDFFRKHRPKNVVIDPVIQSSTGIEVVKKKAISLIKEILFPMSLILTPNIYEASILAGIEVYDIETMKKAAEKIIKSGVKNVLVKGGHLNGDPIDIFFDGINYEIFRSKRVTQKSVHGLGCSFSSAITSCLALGLGVRDSILNAKKVLNKLLRRPLKIGIGLDVLNHNLKLRY